MEGNKIMEKLCINCKHVKSRDSVDPDLAYVCKRPTEKSLVDGKTGTNDNYCYFERLYGATSFLMGRCGKAGRFFEEKEKTDDQKRND